MTHNLCPELHYRTTSSGIMLTACYGTDGCIILPDTIDGIPITAVAPYAFAEGGAAGSEHGVGEMGCGGVWLSPDALLAGERRRLFAGEITEVHLPRYVREIGNYAFYRCRNMKRLVLHDELPSIGGGALTGCRFGEAEIILHKGEKSALKSILDEIRFAVHVRFRHADTEETWELLFPEHYEEAVENTPARILYTSHHGAGGYYRQCFYDRELDYKKYDGLFPRAIAEEEEEAAAELALLRLVFPHRLSASAKSVYEEYLKTHINIAAGFLIRREDIEKMKFLVKKGFWTDGAFDYGIAYAGKLKKTEVLSFLMDEKHKRFPKKRKSFEL